jgi:hypothetical protein
VEKQINTCQILQNTVFLLVLVISCVLYSNGYSGNFFFFLNLILCIITILKGKLSFFSLQSVVLNFPAIPAFCQYNYGKSYGILQVTSYHLYYDEMMWYLFLYNAIILFWLINSSFLTKEKKLVKSSCSFSETSAIFCACVAIVATLIAFPSVPFIFVKEARFQALLPGHAWNHLAVVAAMFAYLIAKKNVIVKFSIIFMCFWFLAHYERVDILGFLIFIIFITLAPKKIRFVQLLKYGILFLIIVLFFVYIGEIRSSAGKDVTLSFLFQKLILQNTACDMAYVFNTSIVYVHQHGLIYGKTLLTYLYEAIPLLSYSGRAGLILFNTYHTPGGEFLLCEPLMNFGTIGIIIFATVQFWVLKWLVSSEGRYRYFVYFFLLATVFRTTWYGLKYIETGVLYFIPILYGICYLMEKHKKVG